MNIEFPGRAPGKATKMAPERQLLHEENLQKLREMAMHNPWIRRAIDLQQNGVEWEYVATAMTLALAQENERIMKLVTRLTELQTWPPLDA